MPTLDSSHELALRAKGPCLSYLAVGIEIGLLGELDGRCIDGASREIERIGKRSVAPFLRSVRYNRHGGPNCLNSFLENSSNPLASSCAHRASHWAIVENFSNVFVRLTHG